MCVFYSDANSLYIYIFLVLGLVFFFLFCFFFFFLFFFFLFFFFFVIFFFFFFFFLFFFFFFFFFLLFFFLFFFCKRGSFVNKETHKLTVSDFEHFGGALGGLCSVVKTVIFIRKGFESALIDLRIHNAFGRKKTEQNMLLMMHSKRPGNIRGSSQRNTNNSLN